MITVDANLVINSQYYALNTRRVNQNAYQSVDSYPEDYSTKNTSNVSNPAKSNEINTGDLDLDAILKELKLYLPENRFSILLQMKREDLLDMLLLLDKDKLGMGLKFFKKEKLLAYIGSLPKEEILKIISQLFSREEFLAMLPIKELNNFFDKVKVEPSELLKIIKSLPNKVLAELYESVTGQSSGKKDYQQFMQEFQQIKPEAIMEGFKALPYKEMLLVINRFTENNPKLLQTFSEQAMCRTLDHTVKSKLIESMQVLNPEILIKLIGQLPDKLLANLNTLIDPEKFSDVLLKFNKNLLRSLAV